MKLAEIDIRILQGEKRNKSIKPIVGLETLSKNYEKLISSLVKKLCFINSCCIQYTFNSGWPKIENYQSLEQERWKEPNAESAENFYEAHFVFLIFGEIFGDFI